MLGLLDAVLFDIGGTLVHENDPATSVDRLHVRLRGDVAADLDALGPHVRVGAVTNTATMTEADVRRLLEPSGVAARLEVIVTSVDAGAAKPDPGPIFAALDRLGLDDPSRVLYVGDTDTDREAALAAGVHFADIDPPGSSGDDGPLAAVLRWADDRIGRRVAAAVDAIVPVDPAARQAAVDLHDRLTKPPGSLGRIEALGVQLAAIAGSCPPPVPAPGTVAVFAGDHGVVAAGVSRWPQEVTGQMVANFAAGGAAVNVLARHAGADVVVVDVGVATDLPVPHGPRLLRRRVRAGTGDLSAGPALERRDALAALDVGAEVAERCVAAGARCLLTGDMGIGNTTASAAIIAAVTGRSPAEVTGRGAGADDAMLVHKVEVIEGAVRRLDDRRTRPPATTGRGSGGDDGRLDEDTLLVLEEVGGLEITALAGFILGGAAARVPVIVDGVIAGAALLIATGLAPACTGYAVAGHRSVEPGAVGVLAYLGLDPVVDLDLRLGEGTGALLALPLVQASAKILREMATFDSAGVSDKQA